MSFWQKSVIAVTCWDLTHMKTNRHILMRNVYQLRCWAWGWSLIRTATSKHFRLWPQPRMRASKCKFTGVPYMGTPWGTSRRNIWRSPDRNIVSTLSFPHPTLTTDKIRYNDIPPVETEHREQITNRQKFVSISSLVEGLH